MRPNFDDTFNELKRKYPVFIALLASILGTLGLFAEFKDSFLFDKWGLAGLIIGVLVMLLLSTVFSVLVLWLAYKYIQKKIERKQDDNYEVLEIEDFVHIIDNQFLEARINRIAKYRVKKPKLETNIYFRIPKYSSNEINGFKCEKLALNETYETVDFKQQEIHSDIKLFYIFKPKIEINKFITLRWSWVVYNGFDSCDDFQLVSQPESSKIKISILFDDNIKVISSEWYKYYGFNQTPEQNGIIISKRMTEASTLIEKDFTKQLTDGASYKIGLHWQCD